MPMIDLTYPAGMLGEAERTALADELTTVLLRAERAPDTEFFRSITWVFVHELPAGHVLTTGRPVQEPIVRVQVTTPQGALSDRRRAELVEAATRAVSEIAGVTDPMRVWVLCREIDEGSWGAGGQVIRFEQLREAAAAAREGGAVTV